MGLIDAAFDSIGGVLSDQWRDIVTSAPFDEHTLVAPGIRKRTQDGRGNNFGSEDILSNGTVIFVPENTAAFVFSQSGIEQVITTPGGYEYRNGEASVFDEKDRRETGIGKILVDQTAERFGFSGIAPEEKRVAFVNLREIRNVKFGTRGPLVYHDLFYETDLELYAYGSFTVRVTNPTLLVRNFVPAGVISYSFDDRAVREQMIAEFLHSFNVAVNELSAEHRISELPSQANDIRDRISSDEGNAGTWASRFGMELVAVAVENIEFSDESRELVRQFSEKKMSVAAYENVSEHAANVAAQQMIAQGVRDNGLGDAGGMIFGMNLADGLSPRNAAQVPPQAANASSEPAGAKPEASSVANLSEQIALVKQLKELLDAGILTEEEFEKKKRDVLGL